MRVLNHPLANISRQKDTYSFSVFLTSNPILTHFYVFSKIMLSVRVLSNSPGIGRPGRVKSSRELVLVDIPYIIAYRVKDSTIEILRVLHQLRMWSANF
ncbi:MAG TPA: type II toxin-antitoxin system mRNA interferase toxin, RelE/StbE family [Candidatus Margulisbacteria bacterium]|nr:type II toxin-antitoxin system mRNA interferase toxin, RelE/StbE family [Candidatus Margulisiibacteriota bacterium]HCT86251.1 type II toxin-antitoxin system mRNA interferase toxin, RelE/StbE family [Candidatus Margulisiibacteriota bacterium]